MDPALKATTTQPWSHNSFGDPGNSPGSEGVEGAHPAHEIQQRGGDGRVRLHGVVHHENGRLWKERAGRTVLNAQKNQHPPLPQTLLPPLSAEGNPFFWLLCTPALIQLLNNIWASSSRHKAGSLRAAAGLCQSPLLCPKPGDSPAARHAGRDTLRLATDLREEACCCHVAKATIKRGSNRAAPLQAARPWELRAGEGTDALWR